MRGARFDSGVRLVKEQKVVTMEFTFVVDAEDAERTLDIALDKIDEMCGCVHGGECTSGGGGGRIMSYEAWVAELEAEEEQEEKDERPKRRRRKSE